LAGEKPSANHNDMVFNTHFGCLSHLHSQASTVEPESRGVPVDQMIMFSNQETKDQIMGQARAWWQKAVQIRSNAARVSDYIGHILHMVTDSYAAGHALRGTEKTILALNENVIKAGPLKVNNDQCGKVYYFQGYPAQAGNNAHGNNDHIPSSGRNLMLYQCATYYAYVILRAFDLCASGPSGNANCNFNTIVGPLLNNEVYNLAAPNVMAGGAVDGFQSPNAAAGFTKGKVGPYNVWLPKSTKRKGNSRQTFLCENLTGRVATSTVDAGRVAFPAGTKYEAYRLK